MKYPEFDKEPWKHFIKGAVPSGHKYRTVDQDWHSDYQSLITDCDANVSEAIELMERYQAFPVTQRLKE